LTRLSGSAAVDALLRMDPELRGRFPSLAGVGARLAAWFEAGAFETVRLALARRVLAELRGNAGCVPRTLTARSRCFGRWRWR
jgi:hypothetical protein